MSSRRILVEGAVIVASILLAFGIQAWWEGVQDRAREARHLQSLRGELSQALAQVPDQEDLRSRVIYAHEALIDQIQAPRQASSDSLLFWISQTSRPVQFDPPRAVYDDIVSSGGTQSITSDALRVELARYGAHLAVTRDADEQAWAVWEQRVQPFLEGRIPRVNRVRVGSFATLYGTPFRASPHPTDFEGVLRDPVFEDVLAERWLSLWAARERFRELVVLVQDVLARIDRELPSAP